MISGGRPKLWAEKEEWGLIQGTRETEIVSVRLLNDEGKEDGVFFGGRALKVRVDYRANEVTKEPHFGVAIFREDGVYCYGPNTLFDGIPIDRLDPGSGFFQIGFNNLPLASGCYRVSVAIWDKREVIAYSYHPAHYKFRIAGVNEENMLLDLEHKWLDGRHAAADPGAVIGAGEDHKREFIAGEDLHVRAGSGGKDSRGIQRPIRIGLYRKDGIYCFGAERIAGDDEGPVTLCLPRLKLLKGRYYASVAAAGKAALYPFEMRSCSGDHGTIYIEHSWEGTAIG
ncbi:MAG: Wzt carbohydrate-binding domain-containing protein [Candidatus Omnitrophica bacterium]|nr:Wzt carbohydrate-binding domain-containing protein [Candidatus Omnitrophota bacterium]